MSSPQTPRAPMAAPACIFSRAPPDIILHIFKKLDDFRTVSALRISHRHCTCSITSTHDTNMSVILQRVASRSLPAWTQIKSLHLVQILSISEFDCSRLRNKFTDFTPDSVLPGIQRLHSFGIACVRRFVDYHQSLHYIPALHDPTGPEIERISRGVYICSLIYNIGRKRRERADQLPGIKQRRRYNQPTSIELGGALNPPNTAATSSSSSSSSSSLLSPVPAPDELGILHEWGYSREDCVLTTHLDHIPTRDLLYALHVATFFRRAYEALYGIPDRFLFERIPERLLKDPALNDIFPADDLGDPLVLPFEGVYPDYQWPGDWQTRHLDLVTAAVQKRRQNDPKGEDRERMRDGPLIPYPVELMSGGDSRMTVGWGCWDFQQSAIERALTEFEILGPVDENQLDILCD